MASSTGSRGGAQAGEAAQGASTSRAVPWGRKAAEEHARGSPSFEGLGKSGTHGQNIKADQDDREHSVSGPLQQRRQAHGGQGRRKKAPKDTRQEPIHGRL